jgi:hypothetical protein
MNCKNCGNDIVGRYCHHCGQKADVGRLNFSYLIKETTTSIFQLNTGFFYTAIQLLIAPGKSIKEYLEGKRKKYFKPVSYLFILSTVYFLVTMAIDERTWMGDFVSGWNEGSRENDTETQQILIWFSQNYAYATLFLVPIFSVGSFLAFLRFKKNYIEHIVINAYVTGQQSIIYSLFAIAGLIVENKLLGVASFALSTSYNFFVYYRFFNEGNRAINILRSLFAYVIYLILSLALFILVFLISKI